MRLRVQVVARRSRLVIQVAALVLGLGLQTGAQARGDPYTDVGLRRATGRVDVPAFSVKTLDGTVIDRDSLKGRVVLANFWATWCEPCKEEMPALERLHAALSGEAFALLAITTDDRTKAIASFVQSHGLTFPILLDEREDLSNALLVRGLPTTILIGKDGRILARAIGPRAWDSPEMIALMRSLLESPP